jgi:hypothetical protein
MNALRLTVPASILLASGVASAGRIDIVSEAQLAQAWQPDPNAKAYVAGYPDAVSDKSRDVCVNIGYLIKVDGSTSDFTEMKTWSSDAPEGKPKAEDARPYVQLAAALVSQRRFVPVSKPRSVYTSATFAFDGSNSLAEEAILERCRIDDLPTFVARAKSRADSRGDLSRARADRERANRSTAESTGIRLD